jgi:dTDP-4-dehydrorhamnose 3,5-epimerase-like enzyme
MTGPIGIPGDHREARTEPLPFTTVAGGAPSPTAGIGGVRVLDFRTIHDPSGNLTPIEEFADVPFDIRRVFFLYDVPGGAERGGHAHRTLQEVVVAVSGSFDVVVEDGSARARYALNRAYYGLYLPPMVWMNLENFSSNSVALVLASRPFEEADYYRDRAEFLRVVRGGPAGPAIA